MPDRAPLRRTSRHAPAAIAVALLAALAFTIAYRSPVEAVESDPAIALLSAQSILDHHTLRLDPYAGHPQLAYRLHPNYRIRHYAGASYPNSLGVPIVSVPAVWIANRLGFHMLDQRAEFAAQNVISAACCALLLILFYLLCRVYLGPAASIAIAAASTFGTPVMSTGATALWSSDYALVFVSLLLLHLARRSSAGAPANPGIVAVLLALGFLCRPSVALLGVALLACAALGGNRRVALAAGTALVVLALAVTLPRVVPVPWMAGNYAPGRLLGYTPLGVGLHGVLFSPSRGLLVFSPFVALVLAGCIRYAPRLRHDRLFWLCAVWIVGHVLAIAVKGRWWGGHGYGPRLMADIVPGLVVLTCLVWRVARDASAPQARRAIVAAYLLLAATASAIHTGQGLFNPAVRLWNVSPNIDREPALAFDWRHPQFLATAAALERRRGEHEQREVEARRGSLPRHQLGTPIRFDTPTAIFSGWYPPEGAWRWTRGRAASVVWRLPPLDARRLYVLEVFAGALGAQRVTVSVNGVVAGELEWAGFDPVRRLVTVHGDVLRPDEANTIDFDVSSPAATATDDREMGLSLRHLRLFPLPADLPVVTAREDAYFGAGFGAAHGAEGAVGAEGADAAMRWTDGPRADVWYPVGARDAGAEHVLDVCAAAWGAQRAEFVLNGTPIGGVVVAPFGPALSALRFPGALLQPGRVNLVEIRLPDAAGPPGSRRRYGLALSWMRITSAASSRSGPASTRPRARGRC